MCRKSVWKRLREAAVESMRPLFRPVQSSEACACLQARTLGITRLRFLPKRSGRPLKLPQLHRNLKPAHVPFACLDPAMQSAAHSRHVCSSMLMSDPLTRGRPATSLVATDCGIFRSGALVDGLHGLQACGRLPTWAVRLLSTSRVLG